MPNRSLNSFDDDPHDSDESWDEDWHDSDADEDPLDADSVPCPECGQDVPEISDRCPACGYWLTESDRARRPSRRKPAWQLATAWLLLSMVLFGLISIAIKLVNSGND